MSIRPRPATLDDLEGVSRLLNHYAAMGDLLPRSQDDLIENLSHFRVIEQNQQIVACGSLEHFTEELAEIRSLMVDKSLKQSGLGRLVVEQLISEAQNSGAKRLMALTYVPEFFHKLGFKTVSKEIFPEKIWGICVNCYKFLNCDEIAVLLTLD